MGSVELRRLLRPFGIRLTCVIFDRNILSMGIQYGFSYIIQCVHQ